LGDEYHRYGLSSQLLFIQSINKAHTVAILTPHITVCAFLFLPGSIHNNPGVSVGVGFYSRAYAYRGYVPRYGGGGRALKKS
jgi:hypothetical protein